MKTSFFIIIVCVLLSLSSITNCINAQTKGEINVTNYTGKRITYMYVAPTGTDKWSTDIVLRGFINDGSDLNVMIPTELGKTCMVDIKTVWADGTEFIWDQLDVCTAHFFTFQPRGFVNIR
ncbi:MAG: hypothetical protein SFY32_17090 [Bacteroidota bacterium]|nr:hypothetical protein [Bacteroidota bacterium]